MAKTARKARRGPRHDRSGLKDPLLFIDTNILLDFYRTRNELGLSLLNRIRDVQDRTISTYQVEMEFKKNRQKVFVDTIQSLKSADQPSPLLDT